VDELTVTCQPGDGVLRLTVDGPVLASNVWQLSAEMDHALREQHAGDLEVDLAGVPLLDSSGISALIAGLTAAHHAGRHLAVINPRPHVYRALQILGLLDVLQVAGPFAAGQRPGEAMTLDSRPERST
jgi:anti-anti-sigma factor